MEIFPHLFQDIRPLLGHQALRETLLAAHGRKVARLCLPEDRVTEMVRLLNSHGLWVDLHNRKQVLSPDQGKGGWVSGYGLEAPVDSPWDGFLQLYVGRDPAGVLAAKKAEHGHQYARFGHFLGYPDCCINFYVEHLPQAEKEQGDFMLPLLRASLGAAPGRAVFPAWNNVAAQYFGYGLLSFYPCSFFCEKAAEAAREAHELLKAYDAPLAGLYLEKARKPILYTEYEGLYLFNAARRRGSWLYYDSGALECSLEGVLAALLKSGDRLKIIAPQNLEVRNGARLQGRLTSPQLGLMVFA